MDYDRADAPSIKPKSVIRLLRANTLSICHLPRRFSITMEPHCALKAAEHLFKNKGCYHHNANDRFGIIITISQSVWSKSGKAYT